MTGMPPVRTRQGGTIGFLPDSKPGSAHFSSKIVQKDKMIVQKGGMIVQKEGESTSFQQKCARAFDCCRFTMYINPYS